MVRWTFFYIGLVLMFASHGSQSNVDTCISETDELW
jgi:hypothetical protein